ncbi:MFS transporter [Pseudonocardia kunmingensis]|uniref:ACS family tartrate transporter-like MFS transporter n=1 Tax=Pseudonocardia kunmingensis TaxID=630975 RepID=A0A543DZ54_9PSEU|nr:MFS transporter [Pseudonocardia kunmingensis]TQM14617.1 ACS family tartrate transporter-like MFS transporter [Pseudonocardia kunmingensis]
MMTTPPDIESRTLRKIMWKFIPLLWCCYFALYLDRLNVSVAALTMNEDLGISPAVFGLVAGVFFWTYSLLEVPSNYVVSRVGVQVWVTRIIISWGLVTMLTAAAQGEVSLILLRLLLGAAEAGFAPAMIVLIGLWFPASKRAGAISLMAVAVLMSGFGTPLSAMIMTSTDGLLGLPGWRWMFLITGLPAVVLGFVFYKVIRNGPSEATFLDPDEKRWLITRLEADAADLGGNAAHPFLRGVLNPRVAFLVVMYILFAFSLFGFQFFIPQMLQQFGFGTNTIGWLAALPPLLAVGPMLWWSRHSDRTGERVLHYAAAAATAGLGFLIAGFSMSTPLIAMIGFCVAGIGLYTCIPIQLAIPSSFLTGAALAGGIGAINGLGNIGGYIGPQVTGIIREATGNFFTAAVFVLSASITGAAVLAVVFALWQRRPAPTAPSPVVLDPA